jgi:WD40 repeat protein
VVTGGADYTVRVWDARSAELNTMLTGHDELVADVAWSPDGTRIASSGENRVFIWEVPAGVKRYRFSNISHFPNIAWSPASDRLAECSWTGIRVWDLPPEAIRLAGHTANFHDAQWSPDGRWIATANHDGTVRIWEAASGAVKQILTHPTSLQYLAWAPDSRRLSTAGYANKIRLWDTYSGEMLRELQSEKELFAEAWSPDGKRLAVTGMKAGILVVFDSQTGETLQTIQSEIPCWLFIRSWSPQGDRFVNGCIIFDPLARGNYPVRVWDADTGKVLLELRKEIADPIVAVYSPDGRYIAVGYSDGIVIVWDAASGEEIVTMIGRSEIILDLSWSPNSQRLAAGYFDGYVLVWDINSGGEVYREQIWDGLVNSIDWSPDGKYLLMSGENIVPEVRRIWQTTDELIAYARECCVWRELTAEERSQFGLP